MNLFLQNIALLTSAMLCFSCADSGSKKPKRSNFGKQIDHKSPDWVKKVDTEVAKLGNFNWVVVADPAFPSLNREGTTVIALEKNTAEVLQQVFNSMESHGHVQPKIYLSTESKALSESETPGITDFRRARDETLRGREARYLANDALELLLLDAESKYRVLVIKTNSLIPYSSVFMELENGYWDAESESALRKRMKR